MSTYHFTLFHVIHALLLVLNLLISTLFVFGNDVFSDCNIVNCRVDSTANSHTHVSFVPMATSYPLMIGDPPPHPHYPYCEHQSTQFFDFVFSTYSASFTCFLISIHKLFEPSSYKEVRPLACTCLAQSEEFCLVCMFECGLSSFQA